MKEEHCWWIAAAVVVVLALAAWWWHSSGEGFANGYGWRTSDWTVTKGWPMPITSCAQGASPEMRAQGCALFCQQARPEEGFYPCYLQCMEGGGGCCGATPPLQPSSRPLPLPLWPAPLPGAAAFP